MPKIIIGDDLNSGTVGRLGNRSMMIEKVNHKLAKANQENIKENTLYCVEVGKRVTQAHYLLELTIA